MNVFNREVFEQLMSDQSSLAALVIVESRDTVNAFYERVNHSDYMQKAFEKIFQEEDVVSIDGIRIESYVNVLLFSEAARTALQAAFMRFELNTIITINHMYEANTADQIRRLCYSTQGRILVLNPTQNLQAIKEDGRNDSIEVTTAFESKILGKTWLMRNIISVAQKAGKSNSEAIDIAVATIKYILED